MSQRHLSCRTWHLAWTVAATLWANGCGDASIPASLAAVLPQEQAVWINGDFESGTTNSTPVGWSVSTYLNGAVSGAASAPPASLSALNLVQNQNSYAATLTVAGTTNTQADPDLDALQSFRYPLFNSKAARVNYLNTAANGNNRNVNLMQQSQVLNANDIDPLDGMVHVRFAIAPVLENPAHAFSQQPYYYVQLLNLTQNATLYSAFNIAGGGGNDVPWHTTLSTQTKRTVQWLNWRLVDISPDTSNVSIGDQVRLDVVGAGCYYGAHFGRIYVDGIGATVPGVYAEATGASTVDPNGTLTYTINYANGGTSTSPGTHVDLVLPHGTSYNSVSITSSCTAPSASNGNTLSCFLGTLSPGATGSFTVSVTAPSSGKIVLGNYGISSATNPFLLGPEVDTTVLSGTYADIVLTLNASVNAVSPNTIFTSTNPLYTITLTNTSSTSYFSKNNNAPTFTDVFPSYLLNPNWSCSVTATGSTQGSRTTACAKSSGTGNVSAKVKLSNSGGQVTYTVWGQISPSATGTLKNTASITAGRGVTDPNMSNNTATVTTFIGNPNRLSIAKTGTGSGSVASYPSGIACGSTCNANMVAGSSVKLYAAPAAGSKFTAWSGACAGSTSPCTFNLSSNANVTANFDSLSAGTAAGMYVYQGNVQTTPVSTQFSTPLAVMVTDSSGVPVSGTTVTFSVTADANGAAATLSANSNTTNALGIASVVANANSKSGTYSVTASSSSLPSVNFQLTNLGTAKKLLYLSGGTSTDPGMAPINTAFPGPLMVAVLDDANNYIPSATVTFSVDANNSDPTAKLSGASGSTKTVTSDSSGIASANITANGVVGNYNTVIATSGYSGNTNSVVFYLQNLSANANKIYAVSGTPQTTSPSTAFGSQLEVVVTDAVGNTVANQNVVFTAPSSGASATVSANPNAYSDTSGLAYADATANAIAGSYTVTATMPGISGASATFSLINDGGFALTIVQGDMQTATVASQYTLPLQVQLTDGSGNAVNANTITVQAPTSGAGVTLNPNTPSCGTGCVTLNTNALGVATVTVTANTASGQFTISASNPNVAGSAIFNLTNLGGNANAISAASGTPQSTSVGTTFLLPLVASVIDRYSNPVQNANVTFALVPSSASATLSATTVTTDVAGQASITVAAGTSPSTYLVTATTSGAAASANFTLTNTCVVDSNCSTGNWCNAGACTATLSNGTAIPTVTGHSPTLNGTCTAAAGTAVCSSGVCDTADNKCGYAVGDGSCTSGNAATVCRTGTCSTTGICMTAGTCLADGDCTTGNWCNISQRTCLSKLSNGTPMPSDANHASPVLNGTCNTGAASLVCAAGVCDTDNACGYANGDGTCTSGNASTLCRSGVCGSDGHCGLPNGDTGCTSGNAATVCRSGVCASGTCAAPQSCTADNQCVAGQWCSISTSTCMVRLANDSRIPTDPGHTSPTLNGNCTASAAQLVCVSGVCDGDNRCGYANGDGACNNANATTVCRSGACGADTKCGRASGEGPCDSTTASTVCRSATCSQDGNCMPAGGCDSDLDCPGQWCSKSTFTCMALLSNGTAMPVDMPHSSPTLDGNCTVVAAQLVCTSRVCDSDKACGYANGDGSCTVTNANTVCRSGVCGTASKCGLNVGDLGCTVANGNALCQSTRCSVDGLCIPLGGCHADGDCHSGQWCLVDTSTCTAPLANGVSMPSDANHVNPTLNGNCTTAAAQLTCASGVCDSDNRCGYANRHGACNVSTAGTVCRSGACSSAGVCGLGIGDLGCTPQNANTVCQSQTCSSNGECMPSGGCLVDADCPGGWCAISTMTCNPLVQNGNAMPSDPGHAVPMLDGNCRADAATLVCQSRFCDSRDNACGFGNGTGPCSNSNATTVCRAGVCGSDSQCGYLNGDSGCNTSNANVVCRVHVCGSDGACGLPNTVGPCTPSSSDPVCRSGHCSAASVCSAPGTCLVDGDCTGTNWCNVHMATCTPRVANGQPMPVDPNHTMVTLDGNCSSPAASLVCVTGVCDHDNRCGYANGDGTCTVGADPVCRSGMCGVNGQCGFGQGEGPCNNSNATMVCRSGTCSVDHTCMPAGGCDVDGDCPGAWCNRSLLACQPLVNNGGALPIDASHMSPTLDGNCNVSAGSLVCASGVCDTDKRCGYINGDGACSPGTSAVVCRSSVCGSDGACGYKNGDGPCGQGNAPVVCRGGACSLHASVCQPVGGCAVDADCGASEYCDTGTYACAAKLPNGTAIPSLVGHIPAVAGTCDSTVAPVVCASNVCDTDNKCGYANGHGDCAGTPEVCRSGSCSADGTCKAAGACQVDSDCNVTQQYCDTAQSICVAKLPNGASLVAVRGHLPVLDGNCSVSAAHVMCLSGVCDTDKACGYKNLTGPCNSNNAGTLCRSSACSAAAGVCIANGGCGVDADCLSGVEWCDTGLLACTSLLANGTSLPTVPGHMPVLDGNCTASVALHLCASGVCDPADNRCGLADGDGPCTAGADSACRSEDCSVNRLCNPAVACTVDGDCGPDRYCDNDAGICAPKLANGVALPVVARHAPSLDGTCSTTSASIVCASGVCSTTDNACGYPLGAGPCAGQAAQVCRSGICANAGAAANTCVACVTDTQCSGARGVCDANIMSCVVCVPGDAQACAGSTPVCNATTATCVPCREDYGARAVDACPSSATPLCVLSGAMQGSCGRCTADVDCAGHAAGTHCDVSTGACVSGCQSNADCATGTYCSTNYVCVPQASNGQVLPRESGGACNDTSAATFCVSGACDPGDGLCGYANGHGPCSQAGQCRSGVCDGNDLLCGVPLGTGVCANDAQCRAGLCGASQTCVSTCHADGDCPAGQFCDTSTCTPALSDGAACVRPSQCQSDRCTNGACGHARWIPAGHGLLSGCAGAPQMGLCAALSVALHLWRRRARR